MLRQSIIYLIISILLIILKKYAKLFLAYIDYFYTTLSTQLSPILTNIGLGNPLQKILLLALVPILITAIPALLYYLIKRKNMPYFFEMTWCIWFIIVLSNLLIP